MKRAPVLLMDWFRTRKDAPECEVLNWLGTFCMSSQLVGSFLSPKVLFLFFCRPLAKLLWEIARPIKIKKIKNKLRKLLMIKLTYPHPCFCILGLL